MRNKDYDHRRDKVRHSWMANGSTINTNAKCTRCGVQRIMQTGGHIFYQNGIKLNENPNCIL